MDEYGNFYKELPMMSIVYPFFIYDMEVYDRYVFFCGEGSTGAILGYFDAYQSCPQVFLCTGSTMALSRFRRIKRMDLYTKDDKLHVAMTAIRFNEPDCVVEAVYDIYSLNVGASCQISLFYDGTHLANIFDDVAVTDNYVVVTARENNTDGRVYYFKKNDQFINSVVGYYDYSASITDTLLITRCDGDKIATATKTAFGSFVEVTAFDPWGSNTISTVLIPYSCPVEDLRLRDITYNRRIKCLKVLTNITSSSSSQAVPIDMTSGMAGGVVIGHSYEKEILFSIRESGLYPNCFIASGHPIYYGPVLRLYLFEHNEWYNCTKKEEFKLSPYDNSARFHSLNYLTSIHDYMQDVAPNCYIQRPAGDVCC